MFLHKILLCFLFFFAFIPLSHAKTATNKDVFEKYNLDAQLVGKTDLQFLIWDIYNAKLYAPNGKMNKNQPFALELNYLLNLKGKKIADKSAEEMKRIHNTDDASLRNWQAQMRSIFPNVIKGDTITGIRSPEGHSIFYKNNIRIGSIQDTEFTKQFFDIWLSEKTMRPDLRLELLGMK